MQKGQKVGSRRNTYPQTPGSVRKAVSNQPRSHPGSSLDSHTGHLNVDLKQINCQLFLQQKWVYSSSAKNCSSESATIANRMQVLSKNGKENSFIKGKRKLGGF